MKPQPLATTAHPPSWWQRLPREARDTLFLLTVIAWTLAPHLATLPAWAGLLAATVLVWRAGLAVRGAPLPGRWTLATVLLLAVVLTAWSHRTLLGREAGVTLLVVLMTLKTLELRARRDAFVVFFLGFFLVLTHFLSSQSLPIAAAMLLSVWGLLTALVLAHMPVGQPSLARAAALAGRLALLGAPIMALLFLLFPRVAPLWGVPADAGARTGLSGEMQIGQIAEIALDDSIAIWLRVRAGTLPPASALYFRGAVLGSFDGTTWRVLRPASAPQPVAELRPTGPPVEIEYTFEPQRLHWLPVLELTPDLPPQPDLHAQQRADLSWSLPRPLAERLRLSAPAWTNFEHGPREATAGLQHYLNLPTGYNPRLLALAAEIRRDPAHAQADGDALASLLLANIRHGNFSYTLSPGLYGENDPKGALDEFWFDRQAGFCEHYAAAFVVLMRALQVPARVVTGFQGVDAGPNGSYLVRNSLAHAWAEYWQPGRGWVRADPTAAVAPERIDRSRPLAAPRGLVAGAIDGIDPQLLRRLRAQWEALNDRWNQWVLSYGKSSQMQLLQKLGFEAPDWEDLGLLLAAALALLAGSGAAWAAWSQHRRDPWLAAWQRLRKAAARQGFATEAFEAPRALMVRLRHRHGAQAGAALAALGEFEALRYGAGGATTPITGRAAMRRAIRRPEQRAAAALSALGAAAGPSGKTPPPCPSA
jgi:transglutaminase-like putative cysteine protease